MLLAPSVHVVLSMELQPEREPLRVGKMVLDRTVGDEDAVTPRGDAREADACGNTVATSGFTTTCFFELSLML